MGLLDVFKKFPIKVTIMTKYNNVLVPRFDKGRFQIDYFNTANGRIERRYLLLKRAKVKIPAPEISFYHEVEEKRNIWLLQIDRNTFYPMSFEKEQIYVTYLADAIDENGNVVLDEEKQPRKVEVKKLILDGSILFKDGKVFNIPTPIAHQTYDKEFFLSNELELNAKLYRGRGFWDKYGYIVAMVIGGLMMAIILFAGMSQINKMYQEMGNLLVEMARIAGTTITPPAQTIMPTF